MAESSHRSRSPEYALLGFLYLRPGHGYDLHRLLVGELGETWHVSQSQAYAILKRLESRGYISATTVAQEKRPALQMLQITSAGRRHFEAWLEAPTGSSVSLIRLEFITRLYFARRIDPGKIAPMLSAQAGEVQKALDRLEANLASLPEERTFGRLSLQLRIRQLRSVLDWLDECARVF